MPDELIGDSDREERRNEVLLAYVEAVQAGLEPDRDQFLAAHPDLREDLETFLANHDEVERLTSPLRGIERGKAHGLDRGRPRDGSGRRPVRASASSATFASCARWAGAGWAWFTRPSRSRCGGGSRSRSCRSPRPSTLAGSSDSRPRHWPRRTCSTRRSSRCTRSAASAASTTTRCSSSKGKAWPR